MSLNATLWAWSQKLTAPQKLILLSLADRAGENHEAWPSIARLELDTGLNRKTIMGHLQNLQDMGLITEVGKVGVTQRVKKYQLNGVGERGEMVPKLEQSQKRNDTKNGTINGTENGTIKQSQKRYSEPTTSFNLPIEPITPAEGGGEEKKEDPKTLEKKRKFGILWEWYGKKGTRCTAEALFLKLSDKDADRLKEALIRYRRQQEAYGKWGTEYVKGLEVFIRNKGLYDEEFAIVRSGANNE
jgi:hypothetical protein